MNCDALHRRLLGLERPDYPPAEARRHLVECPACRAWHLQLLHAERAAASLPVPEPTRKAAFLEGLLNGEVPATSDPIILAFPARPADPVKTKKERGRRKMAFAFALAAGLLVVAVCAWLWQRSGDSRRRGPETLLAQRLKHEPRWTHARTAPERLVVLSDLADEAKNKACTLARAGSSELADQVKLYRQVIHEILVTEAPHLTLEERARALQPISDHLIRAESDALRVASELKGHPQAAPLRELADAARDANRELRRLL